jgi:hypothetical protein
MAIAEAGPGPIAHEAMLAGNAASSASGDEQGAGKRRTDLPWCSHEYC